MEYKFDQKTGLVSFKFMGGGKKAYKANIDLKSFYIELNNLLVEKDFQDLTKAPSRKLKGELDDKNNLARPFNMFEDEFYYIDLDNKIDFEIKWSAKRESFVFGEDAEIIFKINLSNRFLQDVEIGEGLNKQKLQSGGWEFRNELEYKNYYFEKKFKKFKKIKKTIPFFPSNYLIENYVFIWDKKKIEHDLNLIKRKIIKSYKELVKKHFGA